MSTVDPFDSATQAGESSGYLFGKLDVSAQFVVLQKGVGKLVYDEKQHSPDDRRTEVTILLNPIDAMNLSNFFQRNVIAESSAWSRVVWPSARGLGVTNARELNGAYVKAELAPTGRKWVGNDGNERVETTFKFLAVYEDEAACVAAFQAERGGGSVDAEPVDDADRKTAEQFLPALVKQANGDTDALAKMLATTPLVSKFFTIDSPEVVELLVPFEKAVA